MRAIDHFKGDKTAHANRAAAHLKLRNWLSALDDCFRVIDVAKYLDEDHDHRISATEFARDATPITFD